jgi:hypothetical protein
MDNAQIVLMCVIFDDDTYGVLSMLMKARENGVICTRKLYCEHLR